MRDSITELGSEEGIPFNFYLAGCDGKVKANLNHLVEKAGKCRSHSAPQCSRKRSELVLRDVLKLIERQEQDVLRAVALGRGLLTQLNQSAQVPAKEASSKRPGESPRLPHLNAFTGKTSSSPCTGRPSLGEFRAASLGPASGPGPAMATGYSGVASPDSSPDAVGLGWSAAYPGATVEVSRTALHNIESEASWAQLRLRRVEREKQALLGTISGLQEDVCDRDSQLAARQTSIARLTAQLKEARLELEQSQSQALALQQENVDLHCALRQVRARPPPSAAAAAALPSSAESLLSLKGERTPFGRAGVHNQKVSFNEGPPADLERLLSLEKRRCAKLLSQVQALSTELAEARRGGKGSTVPKAHRKASLDCLGSADCEETAGQRLLESLTKLSSVVEASERAARQRDALARVCLRMDHCLGLSWTWVTTLLDSRASAELKVALALKQRALAESFGAVASPS